MVPFRDLESNCLTGSIDLTKLISSNSMRTTEDKLMESKKPQSELSIGEILTQTFNLYSRNFANYLIPFLAAGILTGLVTMAVRSAIVIPIAPVHPTPQQLSAWFSTYLTATITSLFLSGIVTWIANGITTGITIKFTSDMLERGQANLQASFNFTLTKILFLLAASIITGILIVLGLIVLVVPGIILALMFSLVYPAIMLEGTGILESFSRSRVLVSNRWLKTLVLLLVLGIIVGIVSGIVGIITAPLGIVSPLISSILTAFITPIFAIAITLYYYSMKARTAPPQLAQNF